MNEMLRTAINQASRLPQDDQKLLADMIRQFVEHVGDVDRLSTDLADTDHRDLVEAALAEGEADIEAGRLLSAEDVEARSERRLSARKHG